jgi:hypothetical protein
MTGGLLAKNVASAAMRRGSVKSDDIVFDLETLAAVSAPSLQREPAGGILAGNYPPTYS